MRKPAGLLLGLCVFLCAGGGVLAAQEMSGAAMPPPKVLVIFREFVKPGKTGMTHEKSESTFVQTLARAKWPTHYLALTSMSGKSRALFITPYDSFEAWEKDNLASDKNAALSASLDRAAVADGDLLSDTDQTVAVYSDDYSLRSSIDIAHMRYFEISSYHVRSGHRKDWDDLVKLVKAGYEKVPTVHWAMYEASYGQEGGVYLVFTGMKSASEIDQEPSQDKDFEAALGEDGMKKLHELESAAIESSQSNLFAFSPKMSYTPEEWIKADPDFWKVKSGAAAPKKPAEKPAPPQ
jgi:hypothetical protein